MTKSLLPLLICLAACKEEVNVSVQCITTAAPAVECTVAETKGKTEVEVCWNFSATCGNGVVVDAPNTCQKVKDGGSVKVTIPADKLSNVRQCAGDPAKLTAKVTNMTLNGKATAP